MNHTRFEALIDKPSVAIIKKVLKKKISIHDNVIDMNNKDYESKDIDEDKKEALIQSLDMLRKQEVANKEPWKARAYMNVIRQLKDMNSPVYTYDDLKHIKGIGKGLKEKITEFIENGTIQQLADYNADGNIKAITELMKVHGIGTVKAKELVETHGVKDIEVLKQRKDLLNEVQKMGLKYYQDFEKRIPRKEMEKHEIYIKDIVKSIDHELIVTLTGSYRRKLADSGDIDVLITHPKDPNDYEEIFKKVIQAMKTRYIVDIFAQGGKKCMAVSKLPRFRSFRRLDLLYTRKHEYPFALAYFTGSGDFNIRLRNIALAQGYSLSEYGLKYSKGPKKGEFIDQVFETEREIFNFLGIDFVEPENRNLKALDQYV